MRLASQRILTQKCDPPSTGGRPVAPLSACPRQACTQLQGAAGNEASPGFQKWQQEAASTKACFK